VEQTELKQQQKLLLLLLPGRPCQCGHTAAYDTV
jgi:hypothetical protein